MAEITVTEQNFEEEVMKSEVPVLLDFWAAWCGPCRMLSPVIAGIAEDHAGRVKVGKVNVDEQPALASAFGIESIPTVVMVRGGKVAEVSVGYRTKEQLEQALGIAGAV